MAFNGFNAATPGQPGHVFRTLDGGKKWTDISGNLPDAPVNSLILDPAYPNTLYAGTDVGAVRDATTAARTGSPSARASRSSPSGSSTSTRRTASSRPARTAAARTPWPTPRPPLRRSSSRRSTPASRSAPSSNVDYTITLKNIGNAAATDVTITDPVPDNTSFVSADRRRDVLGAATVTWSGPAVAGRRQHDGALHRQHRRRAEEEGRRRSSTTASKATAAGGFGTTGSPFVTPIAPPYALDAHAGGAAGRRPRRHERPVHADDREHRLQRRHVHAVGDERMDDDVLRRDVHDAADDDAARRGRATRWTSAPRWPFRPARPTATPNTEP